MDVKLKIKSAYELLAEAYSRWYKDDIPKMAAALAYYTVFSVTPLFVLVIGIVSLVVGEEAARGELFDKLDSVLVSSIAQTIEAALSNLKIQGHGVLATVLGAIALLIGATGVFAELQSSLNRIWNATPRQAEGILHFLRVRVISLGMVLAIGFLLLVSLILSSLLSAMTGYLGGTMAVWAEFWQVINFAVSFLIITALFAAMFKILPDVKIRWRDVWRGAAVTAFLFTIGKSLLGVYLGRSAIASAFGAAGSLVLLLIWIYYSSQIFFFGAEFTKVYAEKYGAPVTASMAA